MKFVPEITIDGIIQIIGFFIALGAFLIAFRQMTETSKVNRIKFIYDLTNDLFGDNKLREFFYKIDYDKFKFSTKEEDLKKFKGSNEERWLDSILYRYDVIGRMVRSNVIPLKDLEYVLFEIVQVYKNKHVKKYIKWLDGEFDEHGELGLNKRRRAHDDFRWLAEEIEKSK